MRWTLLRAGVALALLAPPVGCVSQPTALQRAATLSAAGQDQAAIGTLKAYLRAHPDSVRERRMLVRLYGSVGDLRAAARAADALARRLGEQSPIPSLELGHALELAHRYDEALELYDRAAAVAPEDPSGPRVGGLRAARWGEPRLAEPRLTEATKRDPNDAEVWHALGLVRVHLGDLAGARRAYEEGLRLEPRSLDNRLGLATVALRSHAPARALVQYEKILREHPGYLDALLGRSWSLIELGRFAAAREALGIARAAGADVRIVEAQEGLLEHLEAQRVRRDNH